MRQPPETLAAILARRPWVATTPDQPTFLTAALTALHARDDLTARTPTPTGPPDAAPATRQPAPPVPGPPAVRSTRPTDTPASHRRRAPWNPASEHPQPPDGGAADRP
jgi:hypothetical protein